MTDAFSKLNLDQADEGYDQIEQSDTTKSRKTKILSRSDGDISRLKKLDTINPHLPTYLSERNDQS